MQSLLTAVLTRLRCPYMQSVMGTFSTIPSKSRKSQLSANFQIAVLVVLVFILLATLYPVGKTIRMNHRLVSEGGASDDSGTKLSRHQESETCLADDKRLQCSSRQLSQLPNVPDGVDAGSGAEGPPPRPRSASGSPQDIEKEVRRKGAAAYSNERPLSFRVAALVMTLCECIFAPSHSHCLTSSSLMDVHHHRSRSSRTTK